MFRLARHVDPELTIGDCLYKRWAVVLSCDRCAEPAPRNPRETMAALPAGATIGAVAARVTCAACGGAEGELATTNWKAGD